MPREDGTPYVTKEDLDKLGWFGLWKKRAEMLQDAHEKHNRVTKTMFYLPDDIFKT